VRRGEKKKKQCRSEGAGGALGEKEKVKGREPLALPGNGKPKKGDD